MKERTKGFIAGVLGATMIGTAVIGVSGEQIQKAATLFYNNIKICIDGTYIEPKDSDGNKVEPFIMDGTTYLPVRAVANAFGKDVEWDGTTSTVFLTSKVASHDTNKFALFEEALTKNGISFEKINTAKEMIGAEEGYAYKIGDAKVEIYRFDINKDVYKKAVDSGKITLSGFNITFDIIFNGEYGIVNCTAETLDIFNSL